VQNVLVHVHLSFVCFCFVLFCSIFILLSRKSDGGAIFWTNPHPLRSCPFPSIQVFSLTSYHLICCLFEATKQRYKAPYPRTQQRIWWGWELNLNHAIVITRGRKNGAIKTP